MEKKERVEKEEAEKVMKEIRLFFAG